MKTGLVTFYHIHHYGALLQAAATQRAVEELGHQCEIVHYYVNQNNALFRKPTGLGSAAADAHTREFDIAFLGGPQVEETEIVFFGEKGILQRMEEAAGKLFRGGMGAVDLKVESHRPV